MLITHQRIQTHYPNNVESVLDYGSPEGDMNRVTNSHPTHGVIFDVKSMLEEYILEEKIQSDLEVFVLQLLPGISSQELIHIANNCIEYIVKHSKHPRDPHFTTLFSLLAQGFHEELRVKVWMKIVQMISNDHTRKRNGRYAYDFGEALKDQWPSSSLLEHTSEMFPIEA